MGKQPLFFRRSHLHLAKTRVCVRYANRITGFGLGQGATG